MYRGVAQKIYLYYIRRAELHVVTGTVKIFPYGKILTARVMGSERNNYNHCLIKVALRREANSKCYRYTNKI